MTNGQSRAEHDRRDREVHRLPGKAHACPFLRCWRGEAERDAVSVVAARTPDRSSGYRPCEATRAFREHNGFVQAGTTGPLPGWQPGNPAAIYVAAVRATR
jgi:hypothetical protein